MQSYQHTDKESQKENSSAIIVSHDMHLSATFADIIIKIRKEERRNSANDEVTYYGVIDEQCIYTPSADKSVWSNGTDSYNVADFEQYLKKAGNL